MGRFIKGDVVVLPFPYSDLSASKKRPALVLATPKDDEAIVCQITTQTSRADYVISLTETDFSQGKLKEASYIRPNHIFMAEPKIIQYSVGKLKPLKVEEVIESVIKILREK